nr:MAG TPA: hypothetical protein [Caudoviricetes sp.]
MPKQKYKDVVEDCQKLRKKERIGRAMLCRVERRRI